MDGHAESAPEAGDLADLASFLDTSEQEPNEELEADTSDDSTTEEGDTEDSENDGQDESKDDGEPSDDEGEDTDPAPERKVKVTVKADDGTETTEEVPESELVKGYQRQADYTRKTQALATRESEAVEFLKTKHEEVRSHYLQQAEVTRAAVVQMAGIKTEQEMAQLANTDPAAWVAESQRQKAIATYLSQLDQQINGEKQAAQQEQLQRQTQQKQQAYQKAWMELSQDGIDKPKLADIYAKSEKLYGFTPAELSEVYDARMVRVLKDAAAFRELQAQSLRLPRKCKMPPSCNQGNQHPRKNARPKSLKTSSVVAAQNSTI